MSKVFLTYCLVAGFCSMGDWLRIVTLNWITIESLGGDTRHNLLRNGICAVLGFALTFVKVRSLPIRGAVIGINVCGTAASVLLAVLLWCGRLTFHWVFLVDIAQTVLTAIAGPAAEAYSRALSGDDQRGAVFVSHNALWIARIVAGLLMIPLSPFGEWWLLIIDALSFLPYIVFVITTHFAADGVEAQAHATEIDLFAGLRALFSERRHLYMMVFQHLDVLASGLSFGLAVEILQRELQAGMTDFCLWLAATGFGCLLGNAGAQFLCRRCARFGEPIYFFSSIGSRIGLLCLGLSGSFPAFVGWYLAYAIVSSPVMPLGAAYFREFPQRDTANISRALRFCAILCLWFNLFLIAILRAQGFNRRESLCLLAMLLLAATVLMLLMSAVWCRQLFQPWKINGGSEKG